MTTQRTPHIFLAHSYWKTHLEPGDCAIDATCGNGHDTEALARLLLQDSCSHLIAIDLQKVAIENTLCRLKNFKSFQIQVHQMSHADIQKLTLPRAPKLVVYNLGYLPGTDKTITTQSDGTIRSLEAAATMLDANGALSITCYSGHQEGTKEEQAVMDWAARLDPKKWQVCHHRWINRTAAPSLFWIKRL